MATFNDMQLIKREFFALRNGIIVDSLRRANAPYRIMFGLTLPQIKEIARATGTNAGLAERLWENQTTRESAMLAPFLFPDDYITREVAMKLIEQSPSQEITDILCMAQLRQKDYAPELAAALSVRNDRYPALRLYMNLLQTGKVNDPDTLGRIRNLAEENRETPQLRTLASQLLQEIEFLEQQ